MTPIGLFALAEFSSVEIQASKVWEAGATIFALSHCTSFPGDAHAGLPSRLLESRVGAPRTPPPHERKVV